MWGPPHQIIPTRGVPNDEVQIGDGFIVVDATFHISYVASTVYFNLEHNLKKVKVVVS